MCSAMWVKDIEVFSFARHGDPFFHYIFGGEDVLYMGSTYNLWDCTMMYKVWHHTGVYHTNMFTRGNWKSKCRMFKPSLLRFVGGAQIWGSCQCGINPSENASPMCLDYEPISN